MYMFIISLLEKQDSLLLYYIVHTSTSTACNCHGLMAFLTPGRDTGSQNIHQCDNTWDVQCAGLNSNRQPFFHHCGRTKVVEEQAALCYCFHFKFNYTQMGSHLDSVPAGPGINDNGYANVQKDSVYINCIIMLTYTPCFTRQSAHHKLMLC